MPAFLLLPSSQSPGTLESVFFMFVPLSLFSSSPVHLCLDDIAQLVSPWLSSCVTWSRAAPSWAPQLFLRSSLWLSTRSIVTSHLDISLHDPQGQRPYFIYSCVSHNPWHIIRIQLFAWMNESMSKWTNLPPPTNRRLCLVHRHSVRHLSMNCFSAPRQCLQAWAHSTCCEIRWQAGHVLQASFYPQAFQRDSPVVSYSPERGQELCSSLRSIHTWAFKLGSSGHLYWDLFVLDPQPPQPTTLIIITFPKVAALSLVLEE